MTPLTAPFAEQLVPSAVIWFLVYLAMKFRGRLNNVGYMHVVYILVIAFLGACTRLIFDFDTRASDSVDTVIRVAVINSFILPLLFSLGVAAFATKTKAN